MACWPTGRLLSTAARLVEHAWVEALDRLGLTHAGMIALHLLGSGPLSQTELAHAARVQTQTMSRTLERLEREGYVVRTRDEHDARRHSVARTDAGTAAWEKSRTLEADLFPALENADAMRDTLLQIISASSAHRW
ncbi:MarR family transcriptional regulator [Cryobacterium sp. TMT1-21]|uniref:MarR family transcriptional regulator n=2 Tax=Microbacteriaceae TaxID=85023 RepID=A0AAQ2C966_9MICO|nr:MarR family transcriptional regulator [Cryobacterium shii]TFC81106.1 MarR family transcriptional regulator [Cryobacterium sp. TmT2-59]TFD18064.1 MarR family transcriptional regulator [Cryobacterium sp. TMT1-21]TFD19700.1 MarR family transcriptional regulator [Cryobacterium sp. TMT4-10]TFD25078.1 MarR family transcriptional regulator [Cryobacterium sp. TMT2-23]TFD40872.1 MarR family transcriptional regulator [Cryobacterium sp. TMT2-10]